MSAFNNALNILQQAKRLAQAEAEAEAQRRAELKAKAAKAEAEAEAEAENKKAEAAAKARSEAEAKSVIALRKRIDILIKENQSKDRLLEEMTEFIQASLDIQPEAEARLEITEAEAAEASEVVDLIAQAKALGVRFSGMKVTLSQYDDIHNLYIQHPVRLNEKIQFNGIPNNAQRHILGLIFLPSFRLLKESKNKGYWRTLRTLSDERSTDKSFTCGVVYKNENCSCEAKAAKAEAQSKAEARPEAESIAEYLDMLESEAEARPETETLKGIPLWTASHNPALGSKVQWIIAKRARALMVQNSVKHSGFTKMDYGAVTKIALTSGKIAKADLMK